MRHAVIDIHRNVVENVIEWDGQKPYQPGQGKAMVRLPDDSPVSAGDKYETGTFTAARVPGAVFEGVTNVAIANTGKDALIHNQEFLDKVATGTLSNDEFLAHVVSLTIDQMKLIRFFLALKQFGGDGITDKPAKELDGTS